MPLEKLRTSAPAEPATVPEASALPGSRAAPIPRASRCLSLVVPVFNEQDGLAALHARIAEVFRERTDWELILVDDGSRDRSPQVIRDLAALDPRVRGVFLARNCGQTSATRAGLRYASGELVATLDADLQNDPADLPAMLAQMDGVDAVVGYRVRRNDNWVRRASSWLANRIRNRLTGDAVRDTGCALKVFRAEALRELPLLEGMHRFLPTLLRYHGYRVVEHPVSHHPRRTGKSKYGIRNRAWRAFKDLLAVRWMRGRIRRLPIREVTPERPHDCL
jgi:glycosyltransferase involved in cell wall biosynthesis